MTASAERSLADLLADLSAQSPAPGGGCAAAWAGALASALAEMAAAFADDLHLAARAAALRADLLAAGERERNSYEPVLEAARVPKSDPARRQRLDAALSVASEAPLLIARASAEVAELAAAIAARSTPALTGDATTAALLAEGSSRAAARLVEVNLRGRDSDPRLAEVAQLISRAGAAREFALRPPRQPKGQPPPRPAR